MVILKNKIVNGKINFISKIMDKPSLSKEFKKSATLHEFPNPEYLETINPVCISAVSFQNEEIKKNESLNNFKSKIIHIQNTENLASDGKCPVSFTPGLSKRRLKRETNSAISSFSKQVPASIKLDNIESTTQNKTNEKEDKNLSLNAQNNLTKKDPLMRLNISKEESKKSLNNSFSFLKQFSGSSTPARQKTNILSSSTEQELKSESSLTLNSRDVKSNTIKKSNSDIKSLKIENVIAEIPPFKEKSRNDLKNVMEFTSGTPEKKAELKLDSSGPQKIQNKASKIMYNNLAKKNILSTIQEETKHLGEFMPTVETPLSPYLCSVVFGFNRKVIYFQQKCLESLKDPKDIHNMSQQMLRYNKVLKQFLTKKKFDSKTRIEMKYILKTVDWSILLSERKVKSQLSFLEKLFNVH